MDIIEAAAAAIAAARHDCLATQIEAFVSVEQLPWGPDRQALEDELDNMLYYARLAK